MLGAADARRPSRSRTPVGPAIRTRRYDVPAGVDLGRYGAVAIWCRAFTVAFGTAPLTPA